MSVPGTASRSTPTTRSCWSLREAERLGTELERALERVASLNPAFVLDEESVLGAIKAQLAKLKRNLVRQR